MDVPPNMSHQGSLQMAAQRCNAIKIRCDIYHDSQVLMIQSSVTGLCTADRHVRAVASLRSLLTATPNVASYHV
jgi:hypothetical protein